MSTPAIDEALLEAAAEIAEGAARLTLGWFRERNLTVDHKADGSEVTAADRAAEQYVREHVAARFPDDTVIGEEAGVSEGTSGRRWIVDPVDGTASFVRGVPLYTTLLAVLDEHGPAIGIVVVPGLDELVVAGRGRGCLHNGVPCRVSTVREVRASCISSSAFDGSWWPRQALLNVADSGAKTRTWGDGYGYFLVATGRIEAMIEPALNTWDIAPMLTIIPEAGGTITDWSGGADLTQGAGWIASNGLIHADLLALVSSDAPSA